MSLTISLRMVINTPPLYIHSVRHVATRESHHLSLFIIIANNFTYLRGNLGLLQKNQAQAPDVDVKCIVTFVKCIYTY